jgi:hypothetical protein
MGLPGSGYGVRADTRDCTINWSMTTNLQPNSRVRQLTASLAGKARGGSAGMCAACGLTYSSTSIPHETSAWRSATGMTSPQAEPPAQALGESLAALAVQVATLRGQIAMISQRLDQAGLRGDLDLAARFEELA